MKAPSFRLNRTRFDRTPAIAGGPVRPAVRPRPGADIGSFVLSIAAGGTAPLSPGAGAAAILIAASSNNLLKAAYGALPEGALPPNRLWCSPSWRSAAPGHRGSPGLYAILPLPKTPEEVMLASQRRGIRGMSA
jgi:hypothetical protein